MNKNVYNTRKAFLIPLIAITVFLFLLFIVSLVYSRNWETAVIAILFLAAGVAGLIFAKKEMVVTDQRLIMKKLFRSKEFTWAEITHLGVVVLKKKVYFLLTTTKGFYIFSNLFEDHALLVRFIAEKLGEEKVEEEVKKYLNEPLERLSLIVMSWIAVAVIVAIIISKISGT